MLRFFPFWKPLARARPCAPRPRSSARIRGIRDRRLVFDALEPRTLLSASIQIPTDLYMTPVLDLDSTSPCFGGGPNATGDSPNQIRGAYGLGSCTVQDVISNGITFKGGVPGDGRGQTIAIIDAYDDPNAASDLNAFSALRPSLVRRNRQATFTS